MPTFDGGHCFLTTLIPINTDDIVAITPKDGGTLRYSHVQRVRELLAMLPTAHQSPEIRVKDPVSPFARCMKTHFARFMVLDDLIFNGRMAANTLLSAGTVLTDPQPVDSLPGPYLFFTADFDAPNGSDAELRTWLQDVYSNMKAELEPVFAHCAGYDSKSVHDANSFADYMIAHQIETTMPFNDYGLPALPSAFWPLIGAAVAAAAIAGAGVWWLLGWRLWPGLAVAVVAAAAAALAAAYLVLMRAGAKPFPAVAGADLPSILKALFLQRALIPKVAMWQGATPEDLYSAVGDFLKAVDVENTDRPSQLPGTIKEVRP